MLKVMDKVMIVQTDLQDLQKYVNEIGVIVGAEKDYNDKYLYRVTFPTLHTHQYFYECEMKCMYGDV